MARIYDSILETIGHTPLLRLNKFKEAEAEILVKVEYFNPAGSIKDRIALAMINKAEEEGFVGKDTVIIEPTSGNTGIGLAMVCAAKGYRLILTMPESMSMERRQLFNIYGAEVVLTPAEEGMQGAIKKAEELSYKYSPSFIPQQFNNPANPDIHYRITALEIWEDTEGKIDFFVAGVGTGGTISGVGKFLKEKNPQIKVVAVEPLSSSVLSGGQAGPHKIEGIGAGFVPAILKKELIDEVVAVKDEDAFLTTKRLVREEGILAGISSGAATWAALSLAKLKENRGKRFVVILPDTAQRYLSNRFLTD